MAPSEPVKVVLDTSVLINFLSVNRMDLLAEHPEFRFVITDHVRREVTACYREQSERLRAALVSGSLTETRVETIEELTLFAHLVGNPRLGTGECAAIAAAVHRNQVLAIDDKAARKAALLFAPRLRILDTQNIMLSLIHTGVLTVSEADTIKTAWETEHNFRLKIVSFAELL